MTTYNAGDTLGSGRLDRSLVGARIKWDADGVTNHCEVFDACPFAVLAKPGGKWVFLPSDAPFTVVSPPPVKVVQPEEPSVLGQVVKIEGLNQWRAVLAGNLGSRYMFKVVHPPVSGAAPLPSMVQWSDIERLAAGRQIVVSSAPQFPETEPPETITEWPGDDTSLRGWRWRDRDGHYWEYLGGQWRFSMTDGVWDAWYLPALSLPLTRVGRA